MWIVTMKLIAPARDEIDAMCSERIHRSCPFPEAIEGLLREGRGAMPPVGRDWNDTEMDALTDYLEQSVGG